MFTLMKIISTSGLILVYLSKWKPLINSDPDILGLLYVTLNMTLRQQLLRQKREGNLMCNLRNNLYVLNH